MTIQDIQGKRFERLVVLSREPNNKHGKAMWLCQCDCGNTKIVIGREVRIGRTKSCGCLRKENAAAVARSRKPRSKRFIGRENKYCPGCKETLPAERFGKNCTTYDLLTGYCSVCHNAKGKENRIKNWGSSRHYHLMRRYGISAEEVEGLLRKQGGVCSICQEVPSQVLKIPWHVDHDHVTGKVRGILCHSCNTGIGNLNDDPEILERALIYLRGE